MDENKSSPERCVLCLDQKRSPVRVQCGHSFCTGCLDVYKSYKKYPWANKCPICRDVLKEKKRTTKRKYSDANAETEENRIAPVVETGNNSSSTAVSSTSMSQQINIFEEFMALAFDVYENADESVQDLTENDDNYYDGEQEAQTDLDFSDSYHEDLNYYTDSDDYNDTHEYDDDDDGDRDYFYFEEDEETYQPPRTRRHVDGYYSQTDYSDEHDENSFINVDDTAEYEVDSLIPRDWNNNNNFNSDIDWETVIASDVIIID